MHHARVSKSARLRRVLAVLSDGGEHSTWDIIRTARTVAVSACISELRANGAEIECRRDGGGEKTRYFYKMTKGPDDA